MLDEPHVPSATVVPWSPTSATVLPMKRSLVLACSVSMLASACLGNADPNRHANAQGKTAANAPAKPQPGPPPAAAVAPPVADAAAPPTPVEAAAPPTPPPSPAVPSTPAADGGPKDLGAQRVDPRWFRKTIFGDEGKVLDTKRTEADAQGRFSSLIRFELEEMDVAACADHLEKLVADDIASVERKTQEGRIQLEGKADDFTITFVCGEANGKTIAYVSYTWS